MRFYKNNGFGRDEIDCTQQLTRKHIYALKKLTLLLKLLDTPHFNGKEEFAELSKLSVLSEIKGLNSLKKLKDLSTLKNKK